MSVTANPVRRVTTSQRLFRITKTYLNGSPAGASFFSSSDGHQPGCYDLPHPNDSCYLADDSAWAWLEVFRLQQVVPRHDIDVRSLVTMSRTGDANDLADLASPAAVESGVTLDLSAGSDRTANHSAALAAHRRKHKGIVGWIATTLNGDTATSRCSDAPAGIGHSVAGLRQLLTSTQLRLRSPGGSVSASPPSLSTCPLPRRGVTESSARSEAAARSLDLCRDVWPLDDGELNS